MYIVPLDGKLVVLVTVIVVVLLFIPPDILIVVEVLATPTVEPRPYAGL